MLSRVACPILMAAATSFSELFIRTTSAASMAMSVPAPIAIPTSARVSEGASLIPSPVMHTFPISCRSRIISSFPLGISSGTRCSIPASLARCAAVRLLSPVSITTSSPIFFMDSMAEGLSSLILSAMAMSPRLFPSQLK